MKAVVVTALGSADKLVLQEVPDPRPHPGEIVIQVSYSGINYSESLARRGMVPTPPTPFVMGLEVVGTVVEIGANVQGFRIGQAVAAFTRSGYAQYAAVAASLAVPLDMPGHAVELIPAIALPCAGVTAHQLLTLVGRLSEGESVFVQGASGGVGSMLGQQAKALGAVNIIGSVGSPAKAAFTRQHGYNHTILRDEFPARIGELTGGKRVNLYLEGISGSHREQIGSVLAPLGRAVFFGDIHFTSQAKVSVDQLRAGNATVAGYSLGSLSNTAPAYWRPSAVAVLSMMASGAISGAPPTLFHPAEAAKAHALLESRNAQGKLALDWTLLI